MNWLANQKSHFEALSSLTLHNSEPFLNGIVMYDEKWILYSNQRWSAQQMDWDEALKHFPKPNWHQKKSWSLLLVWSITAFWILVKPLYLRSLLSKLMRCTENCNTWSRHWSTERAQFSMTTPDHKLHNQRCKSWMNWVQSFASTAIFTWLLANWLPLCFHNQEAEDAFQEFIESWSMHFYTIGINQHFLLSKMCWL